MVKDKVNKDEFLEYFKTHRYVDTAKHFNISLGSVAKLAMIFSCKKYEKVDFTGLEEFIKTHSEKEAAIEYGTQLKLVHRALQKKGLNEFFDKAKRDRKIVELANDHTVIQISDITKTSVPTVREILRKNQIKIKRNIMPSENCQKQAKDYAFEYIYSHSITTVADAFGVTRQYVSGVLDRNDYHLVYMPQKKINEWVMENAVSEH